MSVFQDFDWSLTGVRVRETGAQIRFSPSLAWDVWRGGIYIIAEFIRSIFVKADPAFRVKFEPAPPRPWYLLWGALKQGRFLRGEPAQLSVYFSDSTTSAANEVGHSVAINARCTDISKSRVAKVFEDIFGYALAIDPETATMPFVEKSEINGVHDGVIHSAPCPRQPDRAYQHLIDNSTDRGTVMDYRCPTVFGTIPLVYLKERPLTQRFANLNTRVQLSTAEDCFSPAEVTKIQAFCAAMQLDWGGIDILRDGPSGRLYIVDVNKTDMGPPLALPLRQKLSSVKTLGHHLRKSVKARL